MIELSHTGILTQALGEALGTIDASVLITGATGTFLYVSSRATQTIVAYRVGPGGALTALDTLTVTALIETPAVTQLEVIESGSTFQLIPGARTDISVSAFDLETDGSFQSSTANQIWVPTSGIGVPTLARFLELGGNSAYIIGRLHSPVLTLVQDDGSGGQLESTFAITAHSQADVAQVRVLDLAGRTFVLASVSSDDTLLSFEVNSDGTTHAAGQIDAAAGYGIADPTDFQAVTIGGRTFIVLAAAGSSTLGVVEIDGEGRMAPTDLVLDTLATRFQGVSAIDVVSTATHFFVIAGGVDDGISLFWLLQNGRLFHLDSLEDSTSSVLENVGAIDSYVTGNMLNIYVGSVTEAGISHVTVDISSLGQSVIGTGTGKVVSGGAGNDVITAVSGSNDLIGMGGADVFIFTASAAVDGVLGRVLDFEVGQDRLDLSDLPLLNTVAQLVFSAYTGGIEISYNEYVLTLVSSDGQTIEPSVFTDETVLNSKHLELGDFEPLASVPDTDPGVVLTGTSGADVLQGGAGDDQLDGLGDDDTLEGFAGDDILNGGSGADILWDHAGDDTVSGDDGDDTFHQGTGEDSYFGGLGTDTLIADYSAETPRLLTLFVNFQTFEGGALETLADRKVISSIENYTLIGDYNVQITGNNLANVFRSDKGDDVINAGSGDDTVFAGGGADQVDGSFGHDLLYGEGGNDVLIGGSGNDTLLGGSGNDSLIGGDGNDAFFGGSGADQLDGGQNSDTYFVDAEDVVTDTGTTGYDKAQINNAAGVFLDLSGWTGVERVNGFTGADLIDGSSQTTALLLSGEAGDDVLVGGLANDVLIGSAGNDSFIGGPGADQMLGGTGADSFDGGDGSDLFFIDDAGDTVTDSGASGTDRALIDNAAGLSINISAWSGVERVDGYLGDDTIDASGQSIGLTLAGGDGRDTLIGGAGNDTIYGGNGADLLTGGQGDDVLVASSGDDVLTGGGGDDFLLGGAGADHFSFSANWGSDIVKDFENGTDLLDFSQIAAVQVISDLSIVQDGANVVVSYGADVAILADVAIVQIDTGDFLFA